MFTEQIASHSAWREEVSQQLQRLEHWLQERDLLTADMQVQLGRMQMHSRSDKLMVAFVAEFSRGKSELINAIFFASYGKRIMPASAGRTTMCPTELGYTAGESACLRLLPIHTRLESKPLMEWRLEPEQWTRVDLNVTDPDQLVQAINKVSETIEVSVADATALGFWHEGSKDNPIPTSQGLIEVPRWRHALINMDHPLLRKGLVILDTPGLNAIGAEPELTMSLLPQAQAIVFILGADTGVTASDLNIWREFLGGSGEDDASRFVVLNKIDTMWDELSTPEQIRQQIERQRLNSGQILGVASDRVLAVSAQKGLLAKVQGNQKLLRASRLDVLENTLSERIVQQQQAIMHSKFVADLNNIALYAQRAIAVRQNEFVEQLAEMQGLMGKSDAAIRHQRQRIAQEQAEFDASLGRAHAVRMVHRKILQQIYGELGSTQLIKNAKALKAALQNSGFLKLGVKKAYTDTFTQLNQHLDKAQSLADEVHSMLSGMFRQINEEYGFSLQADLPPRLDKYHKELRAIEASHEQFLGIGNILKLSQPEFVDRLVRALVSRTRPTFENALDDIEQWSRSVSSQIDTQLRERRRSFKRRLDVIERAQDAASDLDVRIREVQQSTQEIENQKMELAQMLRQIGCRV